MQNKVVDGLGLVIATTGRQEVVSQTISSLLCRSSLPAYIVIIGAQESDLPVGHLSKPEISLISAISPRKGLPIQRNYGVSQLPKDIHYVSFLDDDVEVHDDYFLEIKTVFEGAPQLVAFSGAVLANGNIERAEARKILDDHFIPDGMPLFGHFRKKWPGLYGCSMNMRRPLVESLRFDDDLPLYALGEDVEIGFRLSQHGEVGGSGRCQLVHLATRTGRIDEVGVGYAQIVNYIYFANKGIGYPRIACYYERLIKTPLVNIVFWLLPWFDRHSEIDRKGRVYGNILALRDLFRGSAQPSQLIHVLEVLKQQRIAKN
jgi:hypothetical protein